ncbi:tail fiber assembly protein [Scandinavium sp.]|uniref:tail fiber assembly protein n=1 Tax=Scandinavium sp. TaxID=2830653 RepID=UPI00289F0D52|nr:tail fiber assembly protein [Scandinavium sp.]
MSIFAVIDPSGVIINTVLWDGETEWQPPEGVSVVLCENESDCIIGGTYDGRTFYPPTPSEESKVEAVAEAEQTKAILLAEATLSISPLQDAAELEIATEDETVMLAAWKKYRVMVNRVDTSKAPYVTWPEKPV